MKLNIVTPVTRPQNLPAIRESIRQQIGKGIDLAWWVIFDAKCPMPEDGWKDQLDEVEHQVQSAISGLAGHAHRNTVLLQQELRARLESQEVLEEWVMSLDDDNILHPALVPWFAANMGAIDNSKIVIWQQDTGRGGIREIGPNYTRVNCIDTAQYMFRTKATYGRKFNENEYAADGIFIQELYDCNDGDVLFIYQPLCYYNYLR